MRGTEKTKKDIADMSGINRSTVSQYLNRKLENQQSDQISKLEEWLEGWLGKSASHRHSALQGKTDR